MRDMATAAEGSPTGRRIPLTPPARALGYSSRGPARDDGRPTMTPTSPYSTRFKIVASAVVAVAVALLVVAVRSFDDGNDDPVLRSGDQDVVEALIPRRDAQVP